MKEITLKYALLNAKEHGKAAAGPVLAKVVGENPELREKIGEVGKEVAKVVKEVNSLSPESIDERLKQFFPDGFHKEKKEKRIGFPELKNVEDGKIVTCHPPGPEKYPHIGHAYACYVNYWYARHYNGRFILRFEDTNPRLVRKEYYTAFLDSYKWLGINWDELVYASDYIEEMYSAAEKLIKEDKAYSCTCPSEKIRELRANKKECKCRKNSVEQNLSEWKKMLNGEYKEGEITLRIKISMKHKNATMRDPSIMRIIDFPHPRTGTKYKVWPMYGFQNAIIDGINKVTFRMRSKEFELQSPVGDYISKVLSIKKPQIIEFARVNLKSDVPSSGRKIRELIQKGELVGWDDPRLTTLIALKRRGFQPEGIKNWILSLSVTKHESTMEWESLESENKKIIDKIAYRFFFIPEPQKILVENSPAREVELDLHYENKEGGRKFRVKDCFYISKEDYDSIKEGDMIRLMDCLNMVKEKNKFRFVSLDYTDYKNKGKRIIHWLPEEKLTEVEILMPDNTQIKGIAENTLKILKVDDVIQFERFGFCRLDKIEDNVYKFWFTHR